MFNAAHKFLFTVCSCLLLFKALFHCRAGLPPGEDDGFQMCFSLRGEAPAL